MSVDEQLINMVRDRFDAVDKKLDDAASAFRQHSESDLKYWRIIDEQQTQLNLIRRVFWGAISVGGMLAGWVGIKSGH